MPCTNFQRYSCFVLLCNCYVFLWTFSLEKFRIDFHIHCLSLIPSQRKSAFIFGKHGNKLAYFQGRGELLLYFGEQRNICCKFITNACSYISSLPSLCSKIMIITRAKCVVALSGILLLSHRAFMRRGGFFHNKGTRGCAVLEGIFLGLLF